LGGDGSLKSGKKKRAKRNDQGGKHIRDTPSYFVISLGKKVCSGGKHKQKQHRRKKKEFSGRRFIPKCELKNRERQERGKKKGKKQHVWPLVGAIGDKVSFIIHQNV